MSREMTHGCHDNLESKSQERWQQAIEAVSKVPSVADKMIVAETKFPVRNYTKSFWTLLQVA